MPLCLSASGLSAWIGVQAFTLAWMHSIEKVRWEEDWRVGSEALQIVSARVVGTGAGMEPPADAVFHRGAWHYRPAVAPLAQVLLAHSPYVTGYELCRADGCRPLAEWLPGIPASATIVLSACAPPATD